MDSQRDSADSGRISELEHRLNVMEVRQSAMERSRQVADMMFPTESRRHVRAAWRENLLAVRSLLDKWIEQLDDKPATNADDNDGRESIPIE